LEEREMPNLFLIDGVPGSGKSDLISHCSKRNWDTVFIKKYTTKQKDTDGFERSDLVYIDEKKFNVLIKAAGFEYTYPRSG
jgi:guanylate kinase